MPAPRARRQHASMAAVSDRKQAPAAAARVARTALGRRLSGFIYGTIIALSVIVAGAAAFPHSPLRIAVLVAATCAVFWTAHVYADALGDSIAQGDRISFDELKLIARREGSIIEAAIPPVVALLVGAVGLVRESVAIWAAFILGVIVLGAEGFVVARVERLGWFATTLVVAANLVLGLFLVALKLFLSH
jgi:hypothetical protein